MPANGASRVQPPRKDRLDTAPIPPRKNNRIGPRDAMGREAWGSEPDAALCSRDRAVNGLECSLFGRMWCYMRRNAYCSLLALPILPMWAALLVAGPQTEGSPSSADQPEPLEEGFPLRPVPYEPPPVLKSADLLPAEVLSGPHHRVVEAVPSDGFLTRFTIESDFGTFEAASPALALTRIQEIGALAELEKLETEDLAKDGFEIPQAPERQLPAPGGRSRGYPERGTEGRRPILQPFGARRQDRLPDHPGPQGGAGRAHRGPPGPGSRLPGAPLAGATQHAGDQPSSAAVAAKLAGRTAADIFGYSEQRREIAKRLNVDPYTDNPVLAKRLDEVAWAAFSGGLGVTAIKALVPASNLVTVTSSASNWVWETTPGDLRVYNEQTLLGLGAAPDDVDRLLRHPFFTTSLRTRLVKALDAMSGVADRAAVMPLALSVTSTQQARFVVESSEMLARVHAAERPLERLSLDGTLIAQRGDTLVVPAPVDAMSWNADLNGFAERMVGQGRERRMYVRGGATPLAQEQLAALGWTLVAWPDPADAAQQ